MVGDGFAGFAQVLSPGRAHQALQLFFRGQFNLEGAASVNGCRIHFRPGRVVTCFFDQPPAKLFKILFVAQSETGMVSDGGQVNVPQ